MPESYFPPSEVAAKIAVSLGNGLLVGIEREWSNKDLGIRTFALTALLGTIAALFAPSMAIMSLVGVFLIIVFANARSLLVDRSLEATTSAALLAIFVLGVLVGQGHLFTPVAAAILMTMLLASRDLSARDGVSIGRLFFPSAEYPEGVKSRSFGEHGCVTAETLDRHRESARFRVRFAPELCYGGQSWRGCI